MPAYLREVIDVTAVIFGDTYNKQKFNKSKATLDFQKYAVGQTIEWKGAVDGLLDEIELPFVLFVYAGSLLTPTMLETVYPLMASSDASIIRTQCLAADHEDSSINHSLVRLESLYEDDVKFTDISHIGAVCS